MTEEEKVVIRNRFHVLQGERVAIKEGFDTSFLTPKERDTLRKAMRPQVVSRPTRTQVRHAVLADRIYKTNGRQMYAWHRRLYTSCKD